MKNEGHKWLWGRIITIIRSFFIELRGRFWRLKGGAKCQSLKSQMKSWYNCYGGCYTVEKSFPIVPIGYLAIDLGIKWETEATEKKSPELGLLLYHHLDGQSCLSRNKFLREGRTQTNWKVLHFMCTRGRKPLLLFPSKIVSFLQQGVAIPLPRLPPASQPFADCLTLFLSLQATLTKSNGIRKPHFLA